MTGLALILVSTLGSHVLSGKILKADRIASTKPTYVKMSNGSLVAIDAKDANAIKFGGATITKADIEASNGVIHVIDSVYLPKRVRAALYAIDKAQKAKAAAGPALQKAKEVGGKALDATKDAAGKVIDKGKEVIEKGKEAVGGAPAPAPSK